MTRIDAVCATSDAAISRCHARWLEPDERHGSELRARLLYDIGGDCADHALQLRIDFKRLPARVNSHFNAPKLAQIRDVVIRLDEAELAELLDLLEGRFVELAERERES